MSELALRVRSTTALRLSIWGCHRILRGAPPRFALKSVLLDLPHLQRLGHRGAHFVGLNARELPWSYDGKPGSELPAHWHSRRPELYERVGLCSP